METEKRTIRNGVLSHLILLLGSGLLIIPSSLTAARSRLPVESSKPAAHNGSISLSPSAVELRGKSGQGTRHRLTITNGTDEPMTFELAVVDVVTRDGKRLFVPSGELSGSIAATAVLTPKRLLVAPGESSSANLTLTLPMETAVRAIVARFQPIDPHAGPNRVGVMIGLGSLITFNLTDAVAARAEPLVVLPQTATTALGFSEWIANTGQEPFIAKGVIAILDSKQHLVTKIDVPRTRFLPGERLELKAEEAGELPPGKYRAVLTLSFEGRILTKTVEWVNR
jgi:hypothetical protein